MQNIRNCYLLASLELLHVFRALCLWCLFHVFVGVFVVCRLFLLEIFYMSDMITFASAGGVDASSSAAHRFPGASCNVLLDYLVAAGLSEQQLQDVQSMLRDIPFRDIDITVLRMDGEQQDLTISCHLTSAGLKKLLADEWTFQASSLQLTIGSRCLGDNDVIAEFVTSTDSVVHVVVCASRAPQDRDEFTYVNDNDLVTDSCET